LSKNGKKQIVILGLDGATNDVIQPLREMGVLPNLDRILKDGVLGNLKNTLPHVTGPAWFALATGADPGRTGVYDFCNRRDRDSLSFEPISSQRMQGQAIWDSFSNAGLRVCVFNYPMHLVYWQRNSPLRVHLVHQ